MDPLIVVAKGIASELFWPVLILWWVCGVAAPFLLVSAVLSLRRIAKAQERLAAASEGPRAAAPGSVLGV